MLLATVLLRPAGVLAVDLSDRLSLNGFYSLDASVSLGGDTVLPSQTDEPLELKDHRVSLDSSVVGLQADFSLTDRLRFTAQAVSSKQTSKDLSPSLEWAYLTYDAGDDLYLRAGKMKMPLLQGTELRHVGFSRLWVRPLVPTSGASGFDDYHGVEFIKQRRLGQYNLKVQGAYGVADHERPVVDDKDVKLLSARLERNESWVNVALMHARHDYYTADRSRLLQKDASVLMGSVEGELLHGKTVVNFGAARSWAEAIPDERLTYLSLGYRLNSLTPYVLYQYRNMRHPPAPRPPPGGGPPAGGGGPPGGGPPRGGPPRGGPPGGGPPGGGGPPSGGPPPPRRNPPKDGELSSQAFSLGVRYDLGASHAIKAQVERQFVHDALFRSQPGRDRATTVISITFEGVF